MLVKGEGQKPGKGDRDEAVEEKIRHSNDGSNGFQYDAGGDDRVGICGE